jgi:hypothetical protein
MHPWGTFPAASQFAVARDEPRRRDNEIVVLPAGFKKVLEHLRRFGRVARNGCAPFVLVQVHERDAAGNRT